MEVAAAMLTIVLLWFFVFHCMRGAIPRAKRSAGELLLSSQPRRKRWQIPMALAMSIVPTLPLVPLALIMADALKPESVLVLMWIAMAPSVGLLPLILLLRRHPDVQFRTRGIVCEFGGSAIVIPWRRIKYCKWMRKPGTLLVQCRLGNQKLRVPPERIGEVAEILGRFVELRDASDKVLNPEIQTANESSQRGSGDSPAEDVQRFRMQFSLKTLLLLMLVASAGFSWLGIRMRRAAAERAVVATLGHLGPEVNEIGGHIWGLDFSTCQRKPTDDDLALVCELTRLECLDLSGAPITDDGLGHLRTLTRLEVLSLSQTPITDAGLEHLKTLERLESLDLRGVPITDAGLKHLESLTRLEFLSIMQTPITDAGLEHLKTLKRLKYLGLWGTQVTNEGVWELQQALPDVEINR